MNHSAKLNLAFLKLAAQQQPSEVPGVLGGMAGAIGGGMLGTDLGLHAGETFAGMADDLLPKTKGGIMDKVLGRTQHPMYNHSIVPPGSSGWAMDALRNTGMTKGHGHKLLSALALLAPVLGLGAGAYSGMDAGKAIGNYMAN